PKYTPELNDIEVVWHDLKAYNLAHQTFTGVAELDGAHSQGSRRSEPRACGRSVGQAANLCLDRQAATLAETGLIRRPIRDLVPLPRDVVAAILVQLERHGTSGAQKKGPSPTRDQPLAP